MDPAPALPPARRSFWSWGWYPLAVFLFSRLSVLLVTGLSLHLDPRLHRGGGPTPLLLGLCRWDCGWYTAIVNEGYATPQHAAFFPLFPLLGKLVAFTGLSAETSLVLVANLAALGGAFAVYRVFERVSDVPTARIGLALQVFWPFSFFAATGYTESLLVLFTALAILWALELKHFRAGAALGLAALARHLSLTAGLALVATHVAERGWNPRRLLLTPKLLALAVPWLLFGAHSAFLAWKFGDPLLFFTVRSGVWQPSGIWLFFERPWWPEVGVYVAFVPVTVLGALLLLRRREWWPLAAFAVPYTLVILTVGLTGLGRFPASCWPVFLPYAALLARRPGLEGPAIGACAMLQGMFLYLYSHSYPIN